MAWRNAFLKSFGPGGLSGVTLGCWLRVLCENGFAIDLPYWPRAAAITLASLPNSAYAAWEALRFGRRVRSAEVHAPLFILGIWRSGTTHLHNLLARDDRFAFPNFYQTLYPATFLTTERFNAPFLRWFTPQRRFQDNVKLGLEEPQEEELALCALTGRSILMSLVFPRRTEFYDRYLTLEDLSAEERTAWREAYLHFLRKLTFCYQRPLVLKSPAHTARIRFLLEMFPEAKFVHIHRHPYEVLQSAIHALQVLLPYWSLQRTEADLIRQTVRQYKIVYDAFFAQRSLIPAGRFAEVRFEALESDPLNQMRAIYAALDLPEFAHVEPALRQYLDSLAGYRKNAHADLSAEIRERVARKCRRCFDEWGYTV